MASELPAGASDGDGTFASSPDMGGFTVLFSLPFSRLDVYKELLIHDQPLGSSPNVTFTLLRPGYTADAPISPGAVRRVEFGPPFHGSTVSELTVAERGAADGSGFSAIKWRQLESTTRLNLLGRDGQPPEFTVTLEGSKQGTLIKLHYNFDRARPTPPRARAPLLLTRRGQPPRLLWPAGLSNLGRARDPTPPRRRPRWT